MVNADYADSGKGKVVRGGMIFSGRIMEYEIPGYKVSVCAREEFAGAVEYLVIG